MATQARFRLTNRGPDASEEELLEALEEQLHLEDVVLVKGSIHGGSEGYQQAEFFVNTCEVQLLQGPMRESKVCIKEKAIFSFELLSGQPDRSAGSGTGRGTSIASTAPSKATSQPLRAVAEVETISQGAPRPKARSKQKAKKDGAGQISGQDLPLVIAEDTQTSSATAGSEGTGDQSEQKGNCMQS
mmetsp:Transcript_27209/g.62759  ORF Transcript_27209/g.62759 Transcript_27209/m.62759 type:complete len:187 (-) Transcript_27209:114-674(-)